VTHAMPPIRFAIILPSSLAQATSSSSSPLDGSGFSEVRSCCVVTAPWLSAARA